MKLKLALAALAIAGSAQAQGFQLNQVELGFEHNKVFANGDSRDGHDYSARADMSVGGGFGLQAGGRHFATTFYQDRWGFDLHGYKQFGDTRLGVLAGYDTGGLAPGKLTYGAEFMTRFGDKLDLEGRLAHQEINFFDINLATVKTWYALTPRLNVTGKLRYSNIASSGMLAVDEYTAGLGLEYNFERAPLKLYGAVEHSVFGQDAFVNNATNVRLGMTYTFGGKAGTKPKRMFSRVDTGIFF